ncbi:type II toxin-antitoxin system VapC family toxin [Gordonia sp. VNK21]|uniref:type II toxin-antitoxin system VapC family toxin n=1 Tax=Gordonia sp. VNK21 TaxID=3382483 RepID=UPI0038D4599A
MTAALLDTSILIAQFSGDETPPDLTGFDDLLVSSLSYSEMMFGLGAATDIDVYRERERRLRKIIEVFGEGLPFTDDCAFRIDQITRDVVRSGKNPRGRRIDHMIAAVAIAHDLTVVTRNASDFQEIAGLRVEVR